MVNDISTLFSKIMKGDRVALGQAMTLVESERPQDRGEAIQLLELCHQQTENRNKACRLAISGAPGVGKSTLIEAIGLKAISKGFKVGVVTIDPTSNISHGSILGDKSRMPGLSSSPSAFVRSSSAGTVLGGIGRRSFEVMTLMEAVGYDIILLETVGVGQSEHVAWQLTDGFILVLQPGGGDELQGIKRGITELADIVIINKADGQLLDAAMISRSHYQNALHYLTPLRNDWEPRVLLCSAAEGKGIDEFWESLRLYMDTRLNTNQTENNRNHQYHFWLSWSLGITANQLMINHPLVRQKLSAQLANHDNRSNPIFKAEYEIEELMKELIVPSTKNNT
ncbi:MAG TPA: methylmalonyl Co-A mutase-associated GTPase MeaB [Saprospiraceae bacterium]|nr:methylmalonyl Co-A mutase-associated GTPase MeaB [Saprospiraceae bacterium]